MSNIKEILSKEHIYYSAIKYEEYIEKITETLTPPLKIDLACKLIVGFHMVIYLRNS